MDLKLVSILEQASPPQVHSLAVVDHTLYVIDGNRLLSLEVPRKTIWQIVKELLTI